MNSRKELIKNTLIIAFGKISTQLISFLLLPLYTTYLSTGNFGTVDLIVTYVVLFTPIITIQLEMAAFRHLIDARDSETEKKKIISTTLQIVGFLLVSFVILYFIVGKFVNIPYGPLILLIIIATIFSNLFLQVARGFGQNKNFAIGSIIAGASTILLNIVLIVGFHMGVTGILTAMVIANILCCIYLFTSLKLYNYIDFSTIDRNLKLKLIKYSLPLVPNGVSWWMINAADRTIISIVLGLSANGVFAIAYKFPIIFSSLFSFFSMSWTESASMHINDKDRDKFFSETYNASIRMFGSLGLILIAYIPLVFNMLINASYSDAYMYIPILIIGAFFNSIVGLYSAIYIAKKMTKQVATTSIMAAGINIVLTLGLIQYIGLYAAAFSTVIAFLAMAIYRHFDVKKYVSITYEKNIFINMALLYALTIAFYYYNNPIGNIANAIIISIIALLFNKSIIKVIKDKIFSMARRKRSNLTSDQEVQEEVQEKKVL